jgi:hypothetical protein
LVKVLRRYPWRRAGGERQRDEPGGLKDGHGEREQERGADSSRSWSEQACVPPPGAIERSEVARQGATVAESAARMTAEALATPSGRAARALAASRMQACLLVHAAGAHR